MVLDFIHLLAFNIIKNQNKFIYYKPKFMNLELRYKLIRVLIRL